MSLNNFSNLSSVTSLPINSLNGRQRSNTSPIQSLSTFQVSSPNNATIFPQTVSTRDRNYNLQKPRQEEYQLAEREQDPQSCIANHTRMKSYLPPSTLDRKSRLKREANSPVYLDQNMISASSNNSHKLPSHEPTNSSIRRVVQCNSNRTRSSDSDVTSISSQDDNINFNEPKSTDREITNISNKSKNRGQRNKWTKAETEALVRGCNNFAIGQWKAIRDSEPLLARRSPGDLKDRFRTYFPDAYRQHYPNAKTHISSRVRSVDSKGIPLFGENAVRRERKQFTSEEDDALKRGYIKFGTAWSSIQRDPIFVSRKATDLRDRFRNAFPDLYAAAGYKPRSRKASGSNSYPFLLDHNQQSGSFEAIDLTVFTHPLGVNGHLVPDQYQLPSLNFLKEHGSDAFSDLRMMIPSPNITHSKNPALLNELPPPPVTSAIMSSALRTHFTNITPRPSITTPRPSDTTPRPRKVITSGVEYPESAAIGFTERVFSSMVPEPTKSPKSLHKTQSSLDLTHFSSLGLVDTNFNASYENHDAQGNSPIPSNYVRYGRVSALPYTNNHFFRCTGLDLHQECESSDAIERELHVGSTESPSIGDLEQDTNRVAQVNNTTDWVHGLDIVSQTFPGLFNLNEPVAKDEASGSHDDSSCGSSLRSFNDSLDPPDERVVYAAANADDFIQFMRPANKYDQHSSGYQIFARQQSENESQSQSTTQSSSQVPDFIQNGHFNQNSLVHEPSTHCIRINSKRSSQSPSSKHSQHSHEQLHSQYLNHEHMDDISLCPSLHFASDLKPTPSGSSSAISVSSTPPSSLLHLNL